MDLLRQREEASFPNSVEILEKAGKSTETSALIVHSPFGDTGESLKKNVFDEALTIYLSTFWSDPKDRVHVFQWMSL